VPGLRSLAVSSPDTGRTSATCGPQKPSQDWTMRSDETRHRVRRCSGRPADLAIIIVSANDARWLPACLSSVYAHAGEISLDVVVADNDSTDGTCELVETAFPAARVVRCANHGFGYGNNRALETIDAQYVLFLNPDTEIVHGTFSALITSLNARVNIGLVGVRQLDSDGQLFPTMRRFPSFSRYLFEALGAERFPFRANWLGERELDMRRYDHDTPCDWTSGSFLLVRREALLSAGCFDERFFLFSEEVDLCLRVRRAGWDIRHLPAMTIVHHFNKAGISPRIVSQDAFSRQQYMRKNFGQTKRLACTVPLFLRHALRAVPLGLDRDRARQRSRAAREALRVLAGASPPPFGHPPPTAVAGRRHDDLEPVQQGGDGS
jgi:N-acetylglucosaminyl-diphospho-decaprenol L-rhamnosyltransferase